MSKTSTPAVWRDQRGSTLILVVLLTLILSAAAIVALRNVARTTQAVAVYRTRAQAQMTSDSADRVFADWVGNKAATLVDAMQHSLTGKQFGAAGVFGASGSSTPDEATRQKFATAGGHLEFSSDDLQSELLPGYGDPRESGLFQLAAGQETFETRRALKWRVRIRDLTDGIPSVGYSEQFCFKKATLAAEAQVGVIDPNWNRANNVAQSRHAVDGLIGPIECGYN